MKLKLFIIATFAIIMKVNAQTPGTLTFSVTTTNAGGNYSPRHLLAIWIETSDGSFVKTKIKYGYNYLQYLNVWKNKSASNVVDATTGETLKSHGTRTFTWNATDISNVLVPDKDYKIWLQMTDKNSNGATANVTFTKGPNAIVNQTFANQGNYTNMSLSWTPTTDINENKNDFETLVFPNPFVNETYIKFTNETTFIPEITVTDLKGSLIKNLTQDFTQAHNVVVWNGTNQKNQKVNEGLYFIKIKIGEKIAIKKVLMKK